MITWAINKQIIWNLYLYAIVCYLSDRTIANSQYLVTEKAIFLDNHCLNNDAEVSYLSSVLIPHSTAKDVKSWCLWTTSCLVLFGTKRRICRKSPPNTTIFPSKGMSNLPLLWTLRMSLKLRSTTSKQYLFIIGAPSHIMRCLKKIKKILA